MQGLTRFGVFELDAPSGELRKKGLKVRLQEQPYQVLRMLLERPGEVVTREELKSELWPGDTFVDFDTGLNRAVRKLREALEDDADCPRFIETLPRRGYRFIAPVEAYESLPLEAGRIIASTPKEGQAHFHKRKHFEEIAGQKTRFVLGASGAVLALGAILVAYNVEGWRARLMGRPLVPPIHSIAVLPLENLSSDTSQEYFADGMTDALITDLAQIHSLRVISRTSVMQYKKRHEPLREIARELNVDAVVEGTVVRSGEHVRIDAQLVRAATDQSLWAQSYEGDLRDVLALQGTIAKAIASQVQAELTNGERARLAGSRRVNPKAYEDYLKGTYFWNQFTPAGIEKGRQYFEQAIRADPRYAPADSGLAICYFFSALLSGQPPVRVMPLAKAAAEKALALDSGLAEAHSALARIRFRYEWDWTGSESEAQQAIAINPNYAEAHREYAVFLRTMGRYEDSIAEAKLASQLDPLGLLETTDLGHSLEAAGRRDEAVEQFQRTLELHPDSPFPHALLGWTYEDQHEFPKAIDELKKAVALSPDNFTYRARLAHAYAITGRRGEAKRILKHLEEESQRKYVSPFDFALVYVGMGENQKAMDWLDKAYQTHAFELPIVYTDVNFEPLRAESRFQNLLHRLGLPSRSRSTEKHSARNPAN